MEHKKCIGNYSREAWKLVRLNHEQTRRQSTCQRMKSQAYKNTTPFTIIFRWAGAVVAWTEFCSLLRRKSRNNRDQKYSKMSKYSVISWFMGFTSLGGLSQVQNSDRTISKAVWGILFIVGCSMTIWNINQVSDDYLKRPVRSIRAFCLNTKYIVEDSLL